MYWTLCDLEQEIACTWEQAIVSQTLTLWTKRMASDPSSILTNPSILKPRDFTF